MKITNKHRLPKPVVELVSKAFYHTPGRMGVTTLQSPAGMYQLKIRHDDEIVEDAIDRLWMLFGSAGHEVLEKAAKGDPSQIAEEKKTIEMDDVTIVCVGDLYEPELFKLSDYKFTSVWSGIAGAKEEWIQQLNCNGYIYRKNGFDVQHLEVFAAFKDWSKAQALRGGNYPPRDCKKFKIPMWEEDKIERYIHDRIAAHKAAEKLPDAELSHCTPEERWQRPTKYAVMKKKLKRAVKLFDIAAEAETFMEASHDSELLSLETRKGAEVRCQEGKFPGHFYCPVRGWCSFYKQLQKEQG